jgi:Ner family transcriptional regulator
MNAATLKKADLEDWHPADIKAALAKRGFTLSRIAFENNLSDSTSLSACLNRPMPANEKRIAAVLDIHPSKIWPSRYEADGTPKLRGIHAIRCTAEMRAQKNSSSPSKSSRKAMTAA